MADEAPPIESIEPDAGQNDPYVMVEGDQPVWQNLGGDH
jgi:hypothetical protein